MSTCLKANPLTCLTNSRPIPRELPVTRATPAAIEVDDDDDDDDDERIGMYPAPLSWLRSCRQEGEKKGGGGLSHQLYALCRAGH